MQTRLLMVYNADSGLANAALESLHKLFSPATYACRLCAITYGLVAMKSAWRSTIEALPHPAVFLHKDEWLAAYPANPTRLPAILRETDAGLETLISAEDFAAINSLAALQAELARKLHQA